MIEEKTCQPIYVTDKWCEGTTNGYKFRFLSLTVYYLTVNLLKEVSFFIEWDIVWPIWTYCFLHKHYKTANTIEFINKIHLWCFYKVYSLPNLLLNKTINLEIRLWGWTE